METKPSFEQALKELEEVTRLLEKGDVPLETSLQYYEKGVLLANYCKELLDSAEQKVKILQQDSNGKFTVGDFITDEEL